LFFFCVPITDLKISVTDDMSASSQKKKHIKAVRPKLRAKEPLLGVFMWGINYSASIMFCYLLLYLLLMDFISVSFTVVLVCQVVVPGTDPGFGGCSLFPSPFSPLLSHPSPVSSPPPSLSLLFSPFLLRPKDARY